MRLPSTGEALPLLRKEYAYWMTTGDSGHAVDVELFDGTVATLNRYVSSTRTPRPESYLEDTTTASHAPPTANLATWHERDARRG